jgi:hypothetical protein
MSVITGTGRRVRGRVKEESELFPLTITEAQRKHHPDGIAVSSVNHRNAEEAACRRHGRLVAGILATFAVDPDAALTVADIAMLAYGVELPEVTKAHRVAVLRAMRRVCELEPRFGLVDGDGPLGQAIIYDRTRALSYGLARLKADYLYHYQWSRVPRGEGSEPEGEAALRARLAPGGDHHHEYVTPGGGWWRHARKALAELEGDQETLAKVSAEQQAEWAAMMAFASEAGFVRDPRPAPPPLPEVPIPRPTVR